VPDILNSLIVVLNVLFLNVVNSLTQNFMKVSKKVSKLNILKRFLQVRILKKIHNSQRTKITLPLKFALLGSSQVKAASKYVGELDPLALRCQFH